MRCLTLLLGTSFFQVMTLLSHKNFRSPKNWHIRFLEIFLKIILIGMFGRAICLKIWNYAPKKHIKWNFPEFRTLMKFRSSLRSSPCWAASSLASSGLSIPQKPSFDVVFFSECTINTGANWTTTWWCEITGSISLFNFARLASSLLSQVSTVQMIRQ